MSKTEGQGGASRSTRVQARSRSMRGGAHRSSRPQAQPRAVTSIDLKLLSLKPCGKHHDGQIAGLIQTGAIKGSSAMRSRPSW